MMIVPEVNELDLVTKKHCKSIVRDYFGIKADRHGKILAGSDSNPVCRTWHKTLVSWEATLPIFLHIHVINTHVKELNHAMAYFPAKV